MISSAIAASSGLSTSASVVIAGMLRLARPMRPPTCPSSTKSAARAGHMTQDAAAFALHPDENMTRAERTANLIGVVLPFAGVIAAVVLLWNEAVDLTDLA